MKKEALKRIFEFLEEKEQQNAPFKWKLLNNEPFTEEDLNIKGNIFLAAANITSIPKGLKVGGSLDLRSSKIKSLPKGLEVWGYLDLESSKIASLPEGLKVGGDLYLEYTKISSLPKGLEVGGDLYTKNTLLTKYSDDELREMVKPGFIKGEIERD